MYHLRLQSAPDEFVSVAQKTVDFGHFRRRDAEPLSLGGKRQVQLEIVGMQNHRCAGGAAKFGEAPNVVDVRVRADDGSNFQFVAFENFDDALDFISGIDDQRFTRLRIANDRAVALEHPYRKDFVDQVLAHLNEYSIGIAEDRFATMSVEKGQMLGIGAR